ncbi:MAG: energy transducer TonB [Burkholderiaceae bacterium]
MTAASATTTLSQDGPYSPTPAEPIMSSRLLIVVAVIGFHVLGLWALQSGLLRRVAEIVVPVQVLADLVDLPQPQVEPAPPPPQPKPEPPRPRPVAQPRAPAPQPAPTPLPVAEAAPQAAIEVAAPPEPEPVSASPAPAPVPVASSTPTIEPPPVVPPSSNAAYLNNTPPRYPPLSRRMGEQGRVVVRAFIDIDGTAAKAEIARSSGFDRLDQAALQTVLRWRYVPGKRGGVPEGMWFNIPISFELK